MKRTKLDQRFFESTRGRLVTLLRGSTKTVNDLAAALELTDNAVRAHLLSLERDGLVRQSGTQPGNRKPHFAYELTDEAEQLFPKAYDVLLNQLVTVLKARLSRTAIDEIMREVGRALAATEAADQKRGGLEKRVALALPALEALGGSARIETEKGKYVIVSENCPLAAAVTEHPEVCRLAQTLLSEIIGAEVREHCDRSGPPRCRFEVVRKGAAT